MVYNCNLPVDWGDFLRDEAFRKTKETGEHVTIADLVRDAIYSHYEGDLTPCP